VKRPGESGAPPIGAGLPATSGKVRVPAVASQTPPAMHIPGSRVDDVIADDAFVGRVINGRIRILRVIARGGVGRVYLGEQMTLARKCAVKVLDPRALGAGTSEFTQRFLFQASISARLTHPNVVKIFDYGETSEGICWLAMELLEGRTLAEELAANGMLEPRRAIAIAQQICRALREAHALGVVHRDMKPGNIFITKSDDDERDFVKVLDFGLVRTSGAAYVNDGEPDAHRGLNHGSVHYMSPEQRQGRDVDARADVYSVGATLYAMVTGQAPFERGHVAATAAAYRSDLLPRLSALIPHVMLPGGLQEILDRCMAKDPEQRFANIEDVLTALKGYRVSGAPTNTGSRPVMVASSMTAPSLGGEGTSRPRAALLVASLLVSLSVVAALVVIRTRAAPAPAVAATPPRSELVVEPLAASPSPIEKSASQPPFASVKLEVATEPPGARVHEDGLEVCATTPCEITYSGDPSEAQVEHLLVITKSDYKVERKLVKSSAHALALKLSRAK
jgi:eukaryotic-like serine/threonine-protein kinase